MTKTILALALVAAPLAQAQDCGSGGGATVCLSASGTGSDVRLSWTVSGNAGNLQLFRDTDSDPDGRSRIATLEEGARSYTDGSAAAGKVYWYWIRFNAGGGSFNSGAAHAVRAGVMRDMTSMQLSAQMSPGWNLGNALEAVGSSYILGSRNFNETAWGNPKASQALLNAIRAAGFRSVRIPVSWKQYADAGDNISPQWMARVAEVVNYAHNAGLIAMINIHWDGGWMQPTRARQAAVNARLTRFWTQIASHFRNHDDTLLFAGSNEVMVDNDYRPPTAEYCEVQKGFNQAFVSAVRATGGNNASRHLVVQAFNTNIDNAVSCNAAMPRDQAVDRLMMEVHYYDPYAFALDEKSSAWKWDRSGEAHTDAQFEKMKKAFIDQGVPVLLGEFGAILRTEYDPAGGYRKAWDQYTSRAACARGIVPMYWDNGYAGNHQMGLFNRSSGAQAFPDVISAIVNACK